MPIDSSDDGGEAPAGPADWLAPLVAAHAAEIDARALIVRIDIDPGWDPTLSPEVAEAMRLLLRLIFSTVPDGCFVDLSAERAAERISSLGAGGWTARWQVAGPPQPVPEFDPEAGPTVSPTPLHPRAGDAKSHLRSGLAGRVCAGFEAAGWTCELSAVEDGREMLAQTMNGRRTTQGRR